MYGKMVSLYLTCELGVDPEILQADISYSFHLDPSGT